MDSYLKLAFKELFAEDGLTVMGRGLGINSLFTKFAQYYSSKENGRKIVFCLNCTGSEDSLKDSYVSSSTSISEIPQVINNEVTSQDRIEKYAQGGCFIITSRILIVDLLDNKVDATSISGLLVYNAHRISETSIEAFIMKVYRERNRLGFVKAFSEEPEALSSGFGKVERLLKVLYVKKLYLWPRFRMDIVQALGRNGEPEVVELVAGLTGSMKTIQSAILVAMNSCIQELKKSTPHLETAQMTLENGLFQAFDYSIKNQLEPEWHRTPARTKQLVSDVGVLRKLLDYLIRYDAFSFYYLLMQLQAASSEQTSPSLWLMSEASNQIFKKAKERVYRVVTPPVSNSNNNSNNNTSSGTASTAATTNSSAAAKKKAASNTVPVPLSAGKAFLQRAMAKFGIPSALEPAQECPPKWQLAVDVLAEIKLHYKQKTTSSSKTNNASTSGTSKMKSSASSGNAAGDSVSGSGKSGTATATAPHQNPQALMSTPGRVLFLVRDSLTLAQLRDVLVSGVPFVADQRYRWFVSQQAAEIRSRANKQQLQRAQQQHRRSGGGGGSSRSGGNGAAGAKRPLTGAVADAVGNSSKYRRVESGADGSGSMEGATVISSEGLSRMAFMNPSDKDLLGNGSGSSDHISGIAAGEVQQGQSESEGGGGENLDDWGGMSADQFASLPMESKLILLQERYLRLTPSPSAKSSTETPDMKSTNAGAAAHTPQQQQFSSSQDSSASTGNSSSSSSSSWDGSSQCYYTQASVLDPALHVVLMTHSEAKAHFNLLRDLRPAYVVLYDPDVALIRAVEAYHASIAAAAAEALKVYFFLYEGSAEEHRYVGALAKEKRAFESLIGTKEHMVISLPDHPADVLLEAASDKALLSMDTRTLSKASNSSSCSSYNNSSSNSNSNSNSVLSNVYNRGKRGVVVDVREFRSTLPSMLHCSGRFAVVPRTLTVADYVLSPEICVERKGIADLFQSFASGRLYNQAEGMGKYYKHPCLLIEFSPDKAFALMSPNEMSSDILQHAITSRIALLALSFPNLRILWSRSAVCTVEIFRSLVGNHEEVSIDKAVGAGSLSDTLCTGTGTITATAARDGDGGAEGEGGGEGGGYSGGVDAEEEGAAGVEALGYYGNATTNAIAASAGTSTGNSNNNGKAAVAPHQGGGGGGGDGEEIRGSAREILLSLPGINVHNFRSVMNTVTSLAELSRMNEDQLAPLIGPVNAKKLYTFFGQNS